MSIHQKKMQLTNPNAVNSLDFSPVTVPVHCRLWNAEEGGECKV